MAYDPGDVWPVQLTVKNPAGVLTAATVALSVTSPSGTVSAPTVSTASTGVYTASVPLTVAGRWLATWTVSGAVTGVEAQHAYVRRAGSNVIPVTDVRARLNKGLTVDDSEIEDMLAAAIAEYEECVGPVGGSVTERVDGGRASIVLRSPQVSAVTAATYTDGTVIDVDDLDLDTATGILHWGYNTAGWFTTGTRNLTVTYTVGALPAHHRETIIADVAGYFAATQRGGAGFRATFPGDGYAEQFEDAGGVSPVTLFPRIRALAPPVIA